MRPVLIMFFLLFNFDLCFSQRTQQVMVAVHADLIRSDNEGVFEKMQGGFEGSFYPMSLIAVTAAVEWWTQADDPILVLGVRVCPIDEAFIRMRWLSSKEGSLGAGFAKPLSGRIRLEAMADYYLEGYLAIRGGVAYRFGETP